MSYVITFDIWESLYYELIRDKKILRFFEADIAAILQ